MYPAPTRVERGKERREHAVSAGHSRGARRDRGRDRAGPAGRVWTEARAARVGGACRRRPLDDAGEELRQHALQRARPDQRRQRRRRCRSPSPSRPASTRGHEAAPIVVGGTMYIVTPYPEHRLRARPHQARRAAEVEVRARSRPRAAQGVACCDVVNRGAAYADGRIFFNTLDDQTIALDADDRQASCGAPSSATSTRARRMTMAPLVVKGKVLVGNSGGEFGVRGWLTALDAATGKIAWRAYSTGPDKDVLIGADFKPFYAQDQRQGPRRHDLAAGRVEDRRRHGVGLDLLRPGARPRSTTAPAIPGPWNPEQRPGDNKWTSGIFARDADTGEARLVLPVQPARPATTTTASTRTSCSTCRSTGSTRKVLRPSGAQRLRLRDRPRDRRGAVGRRRSCTSPRRTGVDLKTGAPDLRPDEEAAASGKVVRDICPASPGAKDWQPSAYSPRTGLLYIPHQNLCHGRRGHRGELHRRHAVRRRRTCRCTPGPAAIAASSRAWDPVARRRRPGRSRRTFPVWSGALVTAGDVVFYGTMDGWFKAVDAQHRRAAVAVQDRLGDHRPADHLPRARRQAVRRRPRPASAAGPARSSPATSTRATAPRRSASSTR